MLDAETMWDMSLFLFKKLIKLLLRCLGSRLVCFAVGERYGVDGQETVGNSLGRAPLGGSEMEAWTWWTDGKPWEIAWGEVHWEGARWERRQGGRTGNRGK